VKHLHTDIVIDAPPSAVWAVLSDLAGHAGWNPFLVGMSGRLAPGERLRVTLSPPGGRRMTMRPVVTEVTPDQALEWWGHLGFRGVFDGRHRFELFPHGTGTRLVQSEVFTGVLVPFLSRSLDAGTAAGFALMNAALKSQVEQRLAGAAA
jgi:hypothetical protein